uniref:Uncharacterized protein n=1 Tax=Solibacter usitatus (strain Ellin6076) TaxID=234267 RepID=Q01TR0_SOLUE
MKPRKPRTPEPEITVKNNLTTVENERAAADLFGTILRSVLRAKKRRFEGIEEFKPLIEPYPLGIWWIQKHAAPSAARGKKSRRQDEESWQQVSLWSSQSAERALLLSKIEAGDPVYLHNPLQGHVTEANAEKREQIVQAIGYLDRLVPVNGDLRAWELVEKHQGKNQSASKKRGADDDRSPG